MTWNRLGALGLLRFREHAVPDDGVPRAKAALIQCTGSALLDAGGVGVEIRSPVTRQAGARPYENRDKSMVDQPATSI